jgi:uncharacterized protein (DUF1501 family)
MQRRVFLKSGGLALVTMGLSPQFLKRATFGMELKGAAKGKVLICLFQRGAADALNVIVPHGERAYYSLRPNISIPRPSANAANSAIELDGFFGLHPSLQSLKPLWDQGLLAPIHAVGSPNSTRSHFDAQDYMETATPDRKGTSDGWLNRYLATHGTCESCDVKESAFRAVAMTQQTPRIFEGDAPTVAMAGLEQFSVRASGTQVQRLEALYRTGKADVVHGTGKEMFDAIKMLQSANPQRYAADNRAVYPGSQFGQRMLQIAQLIKSDLGLEIAFADMGGWDTHANQGASTGQLATRLEDFSRSIAAFAQDMGDRMENIVVMTMSEFGRTVKENGNRGTDHGHAGSMFVIGGAVKGKKVYGKWPGLESGQLHEGRDLALTTDFRTVFSEVAGKHLGASKLAEIFPRFEANKGWLGVLG